MLVGNKLDLAASRKTPREMGEAYAQEEGLLFAEASAKSGDGVEDLFMEIGMSTNRLMLLSGIAMYITGLTCSPEAANDSSAGSYDRQARCQGQESA